MRERFGALRNLPPFLKLIWQTSARLTAANLGLRLIRALLPVATLYVGKLIIDEVIRLAQLPGNPVSPRDWLASGTFTCAALVPATVTASAVRAMTWTEVSASSWNVVRRGSWRWSSSLKTRSSTEDSSGPRSRTATGTL